MKVEVEVANSAAKGGKARAARMTPEERSVRAREAALARWGSPEPRSIASGLLSIGGIELSCSVLDNGTRVLTQGTFLTALGRSRRPQGGTGIESTTSHLPPFLSAPNLRPFIDDELIEASRAMAYRTESGVRTYGYDATLLPAVCGVYLDAHDNGRILPPQRHVVAQCYILVRGLAHVGIIALVDEATGYQEQRARDELSKILEHYIARELLPWTRKFPDEFFRELYRLQAWQYRPGTAKRTPFVGHLINKYIYEKLPPGVLPQLQRLNPTQEDTGRRRYKHFQFLSAETGNPHLDKQITLVTTLMRIASDKDEFVSLFDRAFGQPEQGRLPLVVEVGEDNDAAPMKVSSRRRR